MRMIILTSIVLMLGFLSVRSTQAHDISEFFLHTDVKHLAFSPDGKQLAVYRQEHYNGILTDGKIEFLSAETGRATGHFFLDNKDVQWIEYVDNRHIAVFSRAYFGIVSNGFRQKRRVSDVVEIYDLSGNFVQTVFDETPFIDDPEPPIINILAQDPAKQSFLALFKNGGSAARLMRFGMKISPPEVVLTGNKSTLSWYLDDANMPYLRMDEGEEKFITKYFEPQKGLKNKWEHVYSGNAVNNIFNVVAKPRDEDAFYVVQNSNDFDRVSLFRLPIGQTVNAELVYQHPVYDLAGAKAFGPNKRLYYAWWWDGGVKRHWFDEQLELKARALELQLGNAFNWHIVDVNPDESVWVINHQGPESPPATSMYNLETGVLTQIIKTERQIETDRIAQTTLVDYTSVDGVSLRAFYTTGVQNPSAVLPDEKLLVIPPRRPGKVDYLDWDPVVMYFAGQGFSVLRPQPRGSEGKGRLLEEEGNREIGGLVQSDIRRAVKAVQEKGMVSDSTPKYLFGFGLGGYAVLQEMTTKTDEFTCGVAVNAPSDLLGTLQNFDRRNSKYNYQYYVWQAWLGNPDFDREKLISRSPVHRADQLKHPLMLIHAYDNDVVSVQQAEAFYRKAKSNGKPIRLVRFDRMGHDNISDNRMFDVLSAADTFLKVCD